MAALSIVIVAGMASAAPMPFIESKVPEAVLDTGNQQRAEALQRWLTAPDLAQQLLPGRAALPADFASRLKADIQAGGTRVTLRLQGSARPDERALFKALVARVTRPGASDPNAELLRAKMMEEQMIVNRKMIIIRGGGMMPEGVDMQELQKQMADQEIRANPPKLVGKSR
jgi:hypothetical protein